MPPADGAAGHPIQAAREIPQGRRWPGAGSSRIPNWVYTDPELFAREQERIFGGPAWFYVGLDAEFPEARRLQAHVRLGAKALVVVRDAVGEVTVLVNRCCAPGRAVLLGAPRHGEGVLCPYHQWTYDLGGRLIAVPFRRGFRGQGGMPADFHLAEHGLERLAVSERHGVVFASFSPRDRAAGGLSRRPHARLFRPRVRRPRARACSATCASGSRATGS